MRQTLFQINIIVRANDNDGQPSMRLQQYGLHVHSLGFTAINGNHEAKSINSRHTVRQAGRWKRMEKGGVIDVWRE